MSAHALIFWNLDNSANQSDPGTGVPFASVGRVTNHDGSAGGTGSAIYLGSGFVLTADHVVFNSTFEYITFDGTTYYQVDTSWKDSSRYAGYRVASTVDLAVVKLLSSPSVAPVSLLTSPSELAAATTLVGWGRGRDPSVPLSTTTVAWGNATTEAKRWGLNAAEATVTISYGVYNYDAIRTVLGSSTGSPAGLGDDEAATALNDSGSAMFQFISGNWHLIGVATAVEVSGNSTFGNDDSSPGRGNYNYFARISSYSSEILALIPEPSSAGLLLASITTLLSLRRIRRSSC